MYVRKRRYRLGTRFALLAYRVTCRGFLIFTAGVVNIHLGRSTGLERARQCALRVHGCSKHSNDRENFSGSSQHSIRMLAPFRPHATRDFNNSLCASWFRKFFSADRIRVLIVPSGSPSFEEISDPLSSS
jgi:hypothetical protein